MSALIGKTLGPYEITGALGSGGMGEVYRAKDTRLGRDVAIKVLPENLAKDPAFKERFDREARTISQLSHAHICTLYDVGHQDGVDYLVMELLEGETLADRLAKSALPPDQVLKLGVQIADALEFAHRSGVVHRDMKPGNIMLTKAGAKLMDFGLAKESAAKSAMGASAMTAMVTSTKPLTTEGTLVGTFQYMAPEQLEGKEADARTDIFGLGVVLYEMATAKRAFTGKTQASVIASILASEPAPISSLQPMTPPALDRIIRGCMAKDPDDRIQTAHDLKMQLQWIVEAGSQANIPKPVAVRRKMRRKLIYALGALAIAAAGAAGYWARPSAVQQTIVSSIELPDKVITQDEAALILSPDGQTLAFVGSPQGASKVWVRPMNTGMAHALDGTENAFHPFWSADGKMIAFFADGKLKKVDATGGPVQTIAEAPDGRGGTWGKDGTILFAPGPFTAIFRVPSSGGNAVAVTKPTQTTSHRWPIFLPDGKHFLYFALRQGDAHKGMHVASLDNPPREDDPLIYEGDGTALYAPPGMLVYIKSGTLMVQPFDAGSLKTTGEAVPLVERVQFNGLRANGNFSVSSNGLLVYRAFNFNKNQITVYDRAGKELGKIGEPASVRDLAISPDGKHLLGIELGEQNVVGNIYLYDVASGNRQKFSFETGRPAGMVWSRDGSKVFYGIIHDQKLTMYVKAANSGAPSQVLYTSNTPNVNIEDVSPDGKVLFFSEVNLTTQKFDIRTISVEGDHTPHTLLTAPDHNIFGTSVSSDGKWLAYASDETHTFEDYMIPFPKAGGENSARWQLSSNGANGGAFSGNDREYIAVTLDQRLVSVPLTIKGDSVGVSPPKQILGDRTLDQADGGTVSRDGQRFYLTAHPNTAGAPITLVTNWQGMLKK
jgi:eukaryotic-like serine/threonine-protein kinase